MQSPKPTLIEVLAIPVNQIRESPDPGGVMRVLRLFFTLMLIVSCCFSALAQTGKGTITGKVTDTQFAALGGARVNLEPGVQPVVSNGQGLFTLVDVNPGTYTI